MLSVLKNPALLSHNSQQITADTIKVILSCPLSFYLETTSLIVSFPWFILEIFQFITTNNTVFVNCAGSSGRFTISNTVFLFIKGLHFIGCGGSTVSQVEDLVVEDTIFEGVEERGTALTLVGVSFAIIARS